MVAFGAPISRAISLKFSALQVQRPVEGLQLSPKVGGDRLYRLADERLLRIFLPSVQWLL